MIRRLTKYETWCRRHLCDGYYWDHPGGGYGTGVAFADGLVSRGYKRPSVAMATVRRLPDGREVYSNVVIG